MTRDDRPSVLAVALAALLAGCAAGGPGGGPSTSALESGPGSGFLTPQGAYLRPLRPGVVVTPILTVGDTLLSSRPEDENYVFYPRPDGLGARDAGNGAVEVYATHSLDWESSAYASRVSRILLNQRSAGVLNADYLLEGDEGYAFLSSTVLGRSSEGFLYPVVLVGEATTDGPRHGVVAAVDVRAATVTELFWLGRFRHGGIAILRHSSGSVVAIQTEDGDPGDSQLWMYLANTVSDLLSGRGRLHVLRADPPEFGRDTRTAAMATRNRPLSGRFVPCDNPSELALARQPYVLETRALAAGCLDFVRLGDVDLDPENTNSFYFTDAGWDFPADPATGRPVTGKGRLYRAQLDPLDPTRVDLLEVMLDGDEGDDLYRPDDIAADPDGLMIQEDPGVRGLHPSRVLRYDTRARRLDPIAVCVERDSRGRLLPEGTGGRWKTTGIIDASALFGTGSWLVTVQSPTTRVRPFGSEEGGGQLLLLRTTIGR